MSRMTTNQRTRALLRAGLPEAAVAAILDVDPADVAGNQRDPSDALSLPTGGGGAGINPGEGSAWIVTPGQEFNPVAEIGVDPQPVFVTFLGQSADEFFTRIHPLGDQFGAGSFEPSRLVVAPLDPTYAAATLWASIVPGGFAVTAWLANNAQPQTNEITLQPLSSGIAPGVT